MENINQQLNPLLLIQLKAEIQPQTEQSKMEVLIPLQILQEYYKHNVKHVKQNVQNVQH